jgi:uncharacterized repeat protein (TIGR01451 family)
MTSKLQRLRHRGLFLTFFVSGIFTYSNLPIAAQTPGTAAPGVIPNTATFRGNNLPPASSNTVTVTAGQADLVIVKTGDRAAAEPGDTILYRVAVRNAGTAPTPPNITIRDTLPLGIRFRDKTLKGSLVIPGRPPVEVNLVATSSNRTVTITPTPGVALPPGATLNIVYTALVTPDAIRGTGRNSAIAQAGNLRSTTASHLLRIRPGILSDCGTLIGRVFVDKNFDGEQQPGEPGVPNAVVYMDDGNRIVTDANGLFSLANVIAGYRSATLDLTSLPGYALAPNAYFIERNSQSRGVKIAPGSMARVNFGVTPAAAGDQQR